MMADGTRTFNNSFLPTEEGVYFDTIELLNTYVDTLQRGESLFTIRQKLEEQKPEYLEKMRASCTPKQLEALERIVINKEEITEVATELEKTPGALYYLVERGLKNIMTKNFI